MLKQPQENKSLGKDSIKHGKTVCHFHLDFKFGPAEGAGKYKIMVKITVF
jgi:hypothetical protein